MIRCHALPCREPGHLGSLAFCTAHFRRLTPLKRSKVEALRSLNAVDPAARVIINQVVLECRQYLLAHRKEERRQA